MTAEWMGRLAYFIKRAVRPRRHSNGVCQLAAYGHLVRKARDAFALITSSNTAHRRGADVSNAMEGEQLHRYLAATDVSKGVVVSVSVDVDGGSARALLRRHCHETIAKQVEERKDEINPGKTDSC